MANKLISFVIPCYRSEMTIEAVVDEIQETMSGVNEYDHEIILVNDGSPDNTWGAIREVAAKHAETVTGINLARNFGQHSALMAGLNASKGDIVICLDDDGQTPANESVKLVAAIENGADVAYARYSHKQHNIFRNFGTAMNEWMASVMIGKPRDLYVSSYFAARRFVVDEMVKYDGSYPYIIGLVLRTTRNIVNVDVDHRKREVGQSGYNISKLFGLWLNGFTAFSIKPLRIATVSGMTFAVIGFIYGIYTIIKKFVNPIVPVGFSALMSALMFIGGMLMLMLGMIGEYLGRLYISQNRNPQYVIRETTRDEIK
ncbi:glycosyltransferase [Butyrivibrio sp. CB08]|uniref:glycosyltransferase family 2 protein n=1 Tax=Butyrivibrio sp. CB08 TaxID=2364879 RepID=UPI000EAA2D07|nr:glycosyltransferase family 2 protein [Butyrivibrio sp. CB08]RKM59819.1 glycosyltransferase [Butyrivibrio sp. CB08]